MKGAVLSLGSAWTVGDLIGEGGFGRVFEAWADGQAAAIKFVAKVGGDRELLFVDLDGVRNVVPIIDHGEYEDYWVLLMPRADLSLRELLNSSGPLELGEGLDVLKDVLDALSDLDGRVVHRDLKPENVLRLDGRWCLADFGIARYAEASTAPDTQKFALSPPYASPERWRNEHATIAVDVYALGIMAYEILSGHLPFDGQTLEALRDQHLHADAQPLGGVPTALEALVEECLYKAAEARPRPANARQRLGRVAQPPTTGGLAELEAANRVEVGRRAQQARRESEEQTEGDRRTGLDRVARQSMRRIMGELRDAITGAATAAILQSSADDRWTIRLNEATLNASPPSGPVDGSRRSPPIVPFDVVTHTTLTLRIPQNRYGYAGRSHSLWFCDAQVAGEYRWFESSYMRMALLGTQPPEVPFALQPGREAAAALGGGLMEYQVAWPFTPLTVGELDDFISRWSSWFATAAQGQLNTPGTMPERDPSGSWRRS
jgi:serine/threonine protein kinase